MCGRFTLFEADQILSREFSVHVPLSLGPRYNIAPSQPVATIRISPATGEREMAIFRWGLVPHWAKDPSIGNRLINARAETAHEKPAFKSAFRTRRCLIPTNGFYEWQKQERHKQPFFVRMRKGRLFAFAGLWDHWEEEGGSAVDTCTILTTGTNEILKPIHDRMPVIVAPQNYDLWLDVSIKSPETLNPILVPYNPEEMESYPVRSIVNDPSHEGVECIEAA